MRILVIGIDGATWRVIDPLIARGQLPNLARLRRAGASGTLRAFSHLLTSAALWTTINSGKVEEKHGVRFFGATSRDVRCKRVWNILDDHGWRVGVVGELITWPPEPVSGFLIPDLFALGPETYPPELGALQRLALGEKRGEAPRLSERLAIARDLLAAGAQPGTLARGAALVARRRLRRREPHLSWFWRKALLQPRLYADATLALARRYRPDYLTFHFHTTDMLSHRYWKHWEPTAFADVPEAEVRRYRDVIPAAYREADRTVGRLLELADAGTTVIVLSDHGFAPIPGGLHKFELKLERLSEALGVAGACVPARLGATHILYLERAGDVDRVADLLAEARIEATGDPLFLVRRGDDFVSFLLADRSRALQGEHVVAPFGRFAFDDLFEDRGYSDSGEHHPDGIVILAGHGIRPGVELVDASILDVAPTILALAGLPIPADMDGRVLEQALTSEFLRAHPLRRCATYEAGEPVMAHPDGAGEETATVLDRLRALGYL